MKKLISIGFLSLMLFLLSGCSELGSRTAIIEEIVENTVTLHFADGEYTWVDETGELAYGECTVEYRYDSDTMEIIKLTAVSQEEDQKHAKGDVREVNFYTSLPSKVETDTMISADDFYAIVSYWGEEETTKETVSVWNLEVNGLTETCLSDSNSTYTFLLNWGEYSGNVGITTDIKFVKRQMYKGNCYYFAGTYCYNTDEAEVTQVFSNGDFVVDRSVYCINRTSYRVHEHDDIKAKFYIDGVEIMTTVLGSGKEYGVVEILEFISIR